MIDDWGKYDPQEMEEHPLWVAEIFEIDQTTTEKDVKSLRQKYAQDLHPDSLSDELAEEYKDKYDGANFPFICVNKAYDVYEVVGLETLKRVVSESGAGAEQRARETTAREDVWEGFAGRQGSTDWEEFRDTKEAVKLGLLAQTFNIDLTMYDSVDEAMEDMAISEEHIERMDEAILETYSYDVEFDEFAKILAGLVQQGSIPLGSVLHMWRTGGPKGAEGATRRGRSDRWRRRGGPGDRWR